MPDIWLNKVYSILAANEDKDFVTRILEPEKAPSIKNDDGTYSSHKMAVEVGNALGEKNDKWYVFPTIIRQDDGSLKDFAKWQKAWPEAKKRGDYIEFDSFSEADWFEKNWKRMWGHAPRE